MAEKQRDVLVWQTVLDAMEAVDADTARAFTAAEPDLGALYRRTLSRFEGLRGALRRLGLELTRCDEVLRPLAFLVDERVLARLSPASNERQQQWPLVQRGATHELFGGDEFFVLADELIGRPDSSSLVIEVYLYCLAQGFVGRFADTPDELERYRASLWACLKVPSSPAASTSAEVPARRGLAQFWLLAAFGCTVVVMFYASVAGYRVLLTRS